MLCAMWSVEAEGALNNGFVWQRGLSHQTERSTQILAAVFDTRSPLHPTLPQLLCETTQKSICSLNTAACGESHTGTSERDH